MLNAYVRSKQNVRDKVRPLEDNCSVQCSRENSSLPVSEKMFNGPEGQLTPEIVASKINNMKENKSRGVDGISPKILKETVEQISTPLAHGFNMSLQEGIVPFSLK